MTTATQPYASTRTATPPLWFLGSPTWVHATAEQTGGTLGLVEQVLQPGFAAPWHVHHAEDEAFYVIEGELTFLCGDQCIAAGAGTFVYGPREIPHGFRVEGSDPARMLLLTTPGAFINFVLDLSEPAPPSGPPNMGHLLAVAARYNVEILGPPDETIRRIEEGASGR
jgi:quercetin dioxygenase-like cupin family protein